MEICVISPHTDDAFLSLHTYLSKLKEQGEDILVVNVFSRTNFSKIGTSVEEKTKYRKQEERIMASSLGIDVEFLDYTDSLLRGYSKLFC